MKRDEPSAELTRSVTEAVTEGVGNPDSSRTGNDTAYVMAWFTSGAINSMHYYFIRIHKTFRVTPAIEAGIADYAWTFEEIVD